MCNISLDCPSYGYCKQLTDFTLFRVYTQINSLLQIHSFMSGGATHAGGSSAGSGSHHLYPHYPHDDLTFGAAAGRASNRETVSQQEALRRIKSSSSSGGGGGGAIKYRPNGSAAAGDYVHDVKRKVVNYSKPSDFNVS